MEWFTIVVKNTRKRSPFNHIQEKLAGIIQMFFPGNFSNFHIAIMFSIQFQSQTESVYYIQSREVFTMWYIRRAHQWHFITHQVTTMTSLYALFYNSLISAVTSALHFEKFQSLLDNFSALWQCVILLTSRF